MTAEILSQAPTFESLPESFSRSSYYGKILSNRRKTGRECKIPLTIRDDIKRSHPLGMLACELREVRMVFETMGTEESDFSRSSRVASLFTSADLAADISVKSGNHVGIRPDDVVLIDADPGHGSSGLLWESAVRAMGAKVIRPPAGAPSHSRTNAVIGLIDSCRPAIFITRNPMVYVAASRIGGGVPTPEGSVRGLIVTGLPHSPAALRRISGAFGGAAVSNSYEMAEFGSITWSCAQGSMHVSGDFFAEIINPKTGNPIAEAGTGGEVVITALKRAGSPLLRYRTGDIGRRYGSCPCGSPDPRIEILGRMKDLMEFAEPKTRLSRYTLEEILYSFDCTGEMYDLKAEDGSALTIALEMEAGWGCGHLREIEEAILARTGIRAVATGLAIGGSLCWKALHKDPLDLTVLTKPGMERKKWLISY